MRLGGAGRRAAVLSGLALLVVAALAALRRDDLREGFHLHRLRARPGYLERIAGEPEGTPERRAVRRFLRSEEGKDALLAHLARALAEALKKVPYLGEPRRADEVGIFCFSGETVSCNWNGPEGESSISISFRRVGSELQRCFGLQDLVGALRGRELLLAGPPPLRLTVLSGGEDLRRLGFEKLVDALPRKGGASFLVRPAGTGRPLSRPGGR